MKAERWSAVERVYHGALERVLEERAAFLSEACGGDDELQREVESLLAYEDKAKDFIENPALEVAGELMADGQQSLVAGQALSHYTIVELLGAGGMGEVYLAEDTRLKRRVALKLLPAELTEDEDRVRRFEQEARAASALNHPNILTIYEIGQAESIHFITTEYIEGDTLRFHLSSVMKLNEVLDISIQVASALAAAHQAGIIHRDIKPENIMIRRDGIVKVLDFGLAKLLAQPSTEVDTQAATRLKTDAGVVMGTASYMSPEQARGLAVDARTDIWSLGVVLYEMVANCSPFAGSSASEVLAAILAEQEPQPLARYAREVPAELERITSKALRKNRDERYQTIQDLLLDLKDFKREVELQAQLKRRAPAELPERATNDVSERAIDETSPAQAAQTATDAAARTTSSVAYIVSQIKHRKRSAAIAFAIVALSAVTAYFYFNRQPVLTDKDTILLADFVNTTGDAVFDGALKQALAVQLGQSPFINIFGDESVRAALRFMGRSPDERVTRDIGREICQRQGLKALLAGSISSLGSHYVITLEAINAQTGDAIAREQVEADNKEQVLRSLGDAATRLRQKLGESLGSIQKFDTPVEQATTSSLEALKAFSVGSELHDKGKPLEAIPFLKHAIELDPNFAFACLTLSDCYQNSGQNEPSTEYAQKAFGLRERVSERERLFISSYYYQTTGEADSCIETGELWKRMYPRDFRLYVILAWQYHRIGQYERAIEAASEGVRLNPNFAQVYFNLGRPFIRLNRFEEAKEIFERALAQKLDAPYIRSLFYEIAFVQGDMAAMKTQIDWANGKPEEYAALAWQARAASFSGQLRRAQEFSSRATDLAMGRSLKDLAAAYASEDPLRNAVVGNCQRIREDTAKALSIGRSNGSLLNGARALALCGEAGQAQPLADELAKRNPKDTLINAIWLPVIRAAIELQRGHPEQTIQFLQAAGRYEAAAGFWPTYLRGNAYLRLQKGAEAAAEFQKILDHQGWDPLSQLYPLAHLGLARAAVLQGDTTKARKAYQNFLALWKDADADLPILIAAQKEYAGLK